MTVNQRIASLRAQMAANQVDAYIILSSDPHNSEYVADHWSGRSWISGFTGSAGTAVVTQDFAGIWTDVRYFVQAREQLKDTVLELVPLKIQGNNDWLDYLIETLSEGATIATDAHCLPLQLQDSISKAAGQNELSFRTDLDLLDNIWLDRPALPSSPIVLHDIRYAIFTIEDKTQKIWEITDKADYLLLTSVDEIAWALNLRGRDVSRNPVFYSYYLLNKNGEGTLYVDDQKLSDAIKTKLTDNSIDIAPYGQVAEDLSALNSTTTVQIDPSTTNTKIYNAIHARIIKKRSPAMYLKAIKSPQEIEHVRNAMRKDGAALARTFMWLEETLAGGQKIIETDIAEKLASERSKMDGYYDESFDAIVGYRGNGAIIHYRAEKETCAELKAHGILLVDSGGQYLDGTTDITRTFTLDNPDKKYINAYTRVLKGMVALTRAIFPVGTVGVQLDILARLPLWMDGKNYGHGTGHGVGYFMNVHEPPQGFVPGVNERGKTELKVGMLTSNEPGHYVEGDYGMRIENIIAVRESAHPGMLEHDTLTVYPFEHALIDKTLLSDEEIKWINTYHRYSYNEISPLLNNEENIWLQEKCREI